MGSRAIVVVCRDADVGARRASASTGSRRDLHAHRPPVLRRPPNRRWPASARPRRAPACGSELETDWLVLDCELLPWSAKAQELIDAPVRAPSAPPAARRWPRAVAVLERAAARGLDVGELLDAHARARRARRPLQRRLPALLWPVTASRTCGSRRSTCSPPRRGASSSATTPGTSSTATRSSPPTPTGSGAPTAASSTSPTRPSRGRDRVVGDADRRRRRGHGRQAAGLHRPRPQGPRAAGRQGAAAASTCGSSTAPSTTRPTSSSRLRSRALGRKRSLASREFALGVEALERFVRGRAAVPRARVRVRGAGAGERAGRPAAVTAALPIHYRSRRQFRP